MDKSIETLEKAIADAERRIGSDYVNSGTITTYMEEQAKKVFKWSEELAKLLKS